jgi:DNA-packaging protein gp3
VSTNTLIGVQEDQYGLRPYARAREDAAESQEGRNMRTGRFLPGHRLWASRVSSGPTPKFADGEALWAACVEYFDWVADNPLYEMQLVTWKGRARQVPLSKMRPMTKGALCYFLKIQRSTWNNWKRDRPDLLPTIEHAEDVIWIWEFNGAAAGLLDEGMVIRQLGIGRKVEQAGTR